MGDPLIRDVAAALVELAADQIDLLRSERDLAAPPDDFGQVVRVGHAHSAARRFPHVPAWQTQHWSHGHPLRPVQFLIHFASQSASATAC